MKGSSLTFEVKDIYKKPFLASESDHLNLGVTNPVPVQLKKRHALFLFTCPKGSMKRISSVAVFLFFFIFLF